MWVDNNSSHKWTIREPGQLEKWTIREDLLYSEQFKTASGIHVTSIHSHSKTWTF